MANEENYDATEQGSWFGSCLLWLFGGASLGFMTLTALALLLLFALSMLINAYLGWELSGLEVSVSTLPASADTAAVVPVGTPEIAEAEVIAPNPVVATATPSETEATDEDELNTTQLEPETIELESEAEGAGDDTASSEVEAQQSTVEAITGINASTPTPQPTPTREANSTTSGSDDDSAAQSNASESNSETETAESSSSGASSTAPQTSNNQYVNIPLEGERDDEHPAGAHGDLVLALREPTKIDGQELRLMPELSSAPDGGAPNFGPIFPNPEFLAAFGVHNWDWGGRRKGAFIENEVHGLTIKTNPGEPLYIPHTPNERVIFEDQGVKYYAVVVYADRDSITVNYLRQGSVAGGYSLHYEGFDVDPNLLKTYQGSKGPNLPGLTLDVPVGTARDELLVVIRDKGTFMDLRAQGDWWR
ncbi:MAG: hypothetical protein AAF485_07795 [Chloroflexota bacterium]